mmetsp:Transcript_19815/g.41407  ORF Transcript_19815/g.41407 Transcript_19815/m.41407 type:complete len:344 (-) Transcript_19815:214-1245(-)
MLAGPDRCGEVAADTDVETVRAANVHEQERLGDGQLLANVPVCVQVGLDAEVMVVELERRLHRQGVHTAHLLHRRQVALRQVHGSLDGDAVGHRDRLHALRGGRERPAGLGVGQHDASAAEVELVGLGAGLGQHLADVEVLSNLDADAEGPVASLVFLHTQFHRQRAVEVEQRHGAGGLELPLGRGGDPDVRAEELRRERVGEGVGQLHRHFVHQVVQHVTVRHRLAVQHGQLEREALAVSAGRCGDGEVEPHVHVGVLEAQDAGEAARELGSAAIRQLDGGGVLLRDEVVLAHLERVLLGGTGDDEVAVLVDGDIHRRHDGVHIVLPRDLRRSVEGVLGLAL